MKADSFACKNGDCWRFCDVTEQDKCDWEQFNTVL